MSAVPLPGGVPASTRPGRPHGRLARRAVGLAAVFGTTLAATVATVATLYAAGEEGPIEDTWLGALLAAVAVAGLAGSVVAFAAAIGARMRGERWLWLWLPLSLLPACLVFLVLGEVFWWE